MNVFFDTNIGLSRKENQDRVKGAVLSEDAAFAVICDGMGGENAGSEASERAINVIYDRITKVFRRDFSENSVKNLLISAVNTANAVVYDAAWSSAQMQGMGTTCVVALVIGDVLHIVSVGDSRAYLISHEVRQLTKDHTIVMKMYENGEISKEELKNHPKRNYITKAVGVAETVMPDYFVIDLPENAAVLLGSDGLTNYCSEEELFHTVKDYPPEEAPARLIKIALDGGGTDNISAAIIK